MNGLVRLVKEYVDFCAGRIRWCRLVYLFVPAPPRKRRLRSRNDQEWATMTDVDNRDYSVFCGRGADCPHPSIWTGKYPRLEGKGKTHFVISANDCRACQYHEKPKRGTRFACCLWVREQHRDSPTTQQITADAVRKARDFLSN